MKIINLKDITINQIIISKSEDGYSVFVEYALIDDAGKEWKIERKTLNTFDSVEKDKMTGILNSVITKIKILEKL